MGRTMFFLKNMEIILKLSLLILRICSSETLWRGLESHFPPTMKNISSGTTTLSEILSETSIQQTNLYVSVNDFIGKKACRLLKNLLRMSIDITSQ